MTTRWEVFCWICRLIMVPIRLVFVPLWYLLLAVAFSPRMWIGVGFLLIAGSALANTPGATSSLPLDQPIDAVIGWLTGKYAWGIGIVIIIGCAVRMYSQWGHSSGGEFYSLMATLVIVAVILNADLIMATLGAAAEVEQVIPVEQTYDD